MMNATDVALMIPSLSAPEISAAMKLLEGEGAIDRANKLVVEFIDRLPIMKVWGDGKSASSDMMSLQASLHLWNARRDPRRKTASMGMYTHVSNQWPIIYHQPILTRWHWLESQISMKSYPPNRLRRSHNFVRASSKRSTGHSMGLRHRPTVWTTLC
jgi:hypothetical protein